MYRNLAVILVIYFHFLHETNAASSCGNLWEDGSQVGLGCLLFKDNKKYLHADAITFCEGRGSSLVEISTQEQLDFLVDKWTTLNEGPERPNGWWGGATVTGEGWRWTVSGGEVADFVWKNATKAAEKALEQQQDETKQFYICFLKSTDYLGHPCPGGARERLAVCQKK